MENIKTSSSDNNLFFITLLKAIACLLITNSHCSNMYPYSMFAFGGGYGNTLFFLCSGYCLAMISLPFFKWIYKRYKRLIPETLIMLLLALLIDGGAFSNVPFNCKDIILFCINKYWFITAILIYYPLFYIVFCKKSLPIAIVGFIVWFIGYVILYLLHDKNVFFVELSLFSPFKVYFYLGVILVGGILRLISGDILKKKQRLMKIVLWIIMLTAGIIWIMEYAAIVVRNSGLDFQFLIHLSVLSFCVAFFILCINMDFSKIENRKKMNVIISSIAASTLEVYLIQLLFRPFCDKLIFPFNIVLFFIIALVGGCLFHNIYTFSVRKVCKQK